MSNLTPEKRVDVNGHLVTRHVKTGDTAAGQVRAGGVGIASAARPNADAYAPETLDEFRIDVTDQDREDGMQRMRDELSWEIDRSWSKVMGSSTRRTAANIADFELKQNDYIESRDDLMAKAEKYADFYANNRAHARAFEAGIETEYDEDFEKMWSGESQGFSEKKFRDELVELARLSEGLEAGTIPPSRVIGTGYRNPKASAREYLERQTADTHEAIRTRGRSSAVNIGNAEYRKRVRENPV